MLLPLPQSPPSPPHSTTTHTKQPTRCSTLNSHSRTSQTRLEDSCFRNCATHERTERPSRPGQNPSQRQSRSQSESLSHSSASSVSKCTKCTNGVKVCESRLVLKRSWIRVVVVCAVRCRCPLYALRCVSGCFSSVVVVLALRLVCLRPFTARTAKGTIQKRADSFAYRLANPR